MIFIAILAAVAATVVIERLIYKKQNFEELEYFVEFSMDECVEGDTVFFYECLKNNGKIPIPYIKISTDLPEGLEFMLVEGKKIGKTARIESVFSMLPGNEIKRRWRVTCNVRGEYKIENVLISYSDLFGIVNKSRQLEIINGIKSRITVLPQAIDLNKHYTTSQYLCGDVVNNHCPVCDPLRICGAREYTIGDPMNAVNWKMTAVHQRLMVNIEEKTTRYSFGIMLNMNSRQIEQNPTVCSDKNALERSITVCTSILDSASALDLPVRLIMNTASCRDWLEPVSDDEVGSNVYISTEFSGRADTVSALRMFAGIKPEISIPAEKMFDHAASHPELYRGVENFIVVSPYIDQRMMNFHSVMKPRGVNVIFYLTTSRNYTAEIPADVEIYYRTY